MGYIKKLEMQFKTFGTFRSFLIQEAWGIQLKCDTKKVNKIKFNNLKIL